MMPTPKWKEKAEQGVAPADAKADSLLDRLKASRWTGAILLGGAAIVIVMLLSLF